MSLPLLRVSFCSKRIVFPSSVYGTMSRKKEGITSKAKGDICFRSWHRNHRDRRKREEESRKPQRQGNRKNSGFRIRVKERGNWWGGSGRYRKYQRWGKVQRVLLYIKNIFTSLDTLLRNTNKVLI